MCELRPTSKSTVAKEHTRRQKAETSTRLFHMHTYKQIHANQTTHLGLEGTRGPGDGRLSGGSLLGLDRSGTTTTLQAPGGSGGGHDDGGDRQGEANDGQGELHDSILGGTEETKRMEE